MPVLRFYGVNATTSFNTTTVGATVVWGGTTQPDATLVFADADGTLSDDPFQGAFEPGGATGNVTVGANTSVGSQIDIEQSWLVEDTVTGERFIVGQLEVESGPAAGFYTMSEAPLVAGRSYEIVAYSSFPSGATGLEFTYYDDVFEGTEDADVIGPGSVDTDGDRIDAPPGAADRVFSWAALGDETPIDGASQTIDGVTVDISVSTSIAGTEASVEDDTEIHTAPSDPVVFDPFSSAFLSGPARGAPGATQSMTIDFTPDTTLGYGDDVENVRFRIADIDRGGFIDRVTISATDSLGNDVAVTVTVEGDETTTTNPDGSVTVLAGPGGDSPDEAAGAIFVTIAGPVNAVTIDYANDSTAFQVIHVSDIVFDAFLPADYDDTIEAGAGDDVIDGGLGADTVFAGDGDDTILVGGGDDVSGEGGDDTFTITSQGGDITISGGETDEDNGGDTLDFNGLLDPGTLNITNDDDAAGGLSGTATLLDGSTVTFTGIETIICYTPGTPIRTEAGFRPVEALRVGDTVWTADQGFQPIRWIGHSTLPGDGTAAPILIPAGLLGNTGDLLVSPQHRFALGGGVVELLFGLDEVFITAKDIAAAGLARRTPLNVVTYIHVLTDAHAVLDADGARSESYFPGMSSLRFLCREMREDLFAAVPFLREDPALYGSTARHCLKTGEAALVLERLFDRRSVA